MHYWYLIFIFIYIGIELLYKSFAILFFLYTENIF